MRWTAGSRRLLTGRPDIVLFDVLDELRLAEVGRLIWARTSGRRPLFAVGSSGLEYALTAHWRASDRFPEPEPFRVAGPVDAIAVVSGSCSPVTQAQILCAEKQGFAVIEIDACRLVDPERVDRERSATVRNALVALEGGRSVVVRSAVGPDDPRIAQTLEYWSERAVPPQTVRERIGEQLGSVLRELLEARPLRRVVVAGGDTSGHVVRRLGVDALEVVTTLATGAPLCRASSRRPSIDGLEIVLKGGQIGPDNCFVSVLRGGE